MSAPCERLHLGCLNQLHQNGDAICLNKFRACQAKQTQEVSCDPYDASVRVALVNNAPRVQNVAGVVFIP